MHRCVCHALVTELKLHNSEAHMTSCSLGVYCHTESGIVEMTTSPSRTDQTCSWPMKFMNESQVTQDCLQYHRRCAQDLFYHMIPEDCWLLSSMYIRKPTTLMKKQPTHKESACSHFIACRKESYGGSKLSNLSRTQNYLHSI